MQIDKRLLLTVLPILVFTLGDLVFTPLVTSLLAIGLLFVEIFYNSVKYHKVDLSLWVELVLLVLLTVVDVYTQNTILYKEIFYALILILPLLIGKMAKRNLLFILLSRYFPSQKLNSFQKFEIERTGNLLLIFLVIYLVLLIGLQIFTYLSGTLFSVKYFSFAFIALFFFLLAWDKRIRNKRFSKESWVPIILEDGSFECSAPRSVAHDKSFLLHPVVHLHLIHDGKIYLQKRPLFKTIQPGKWDTAVGGHVDMGETIEQALYREAYEELGIVVRDEFFVKRYVWQSRVERELVFTYLCFWNEDVFPDPTELDGGKYWSMDEIDQLKFKDLFTPNFLEEYEWLKEIVLQSFSEDQYGNSTAEKLD